MIRYEHGNYYTRAHARKPEGIEDKQAWIVGSGLAGLAAGIALVRDAQMPGKNIHIFEKCATAGGALMPWNSRSWDTPCAATGKWKTISRSCGIF